MVASRESAESAGVVPRVVEVNRGEALRLLEEEDDVDLKELTEEPRPRLARGCRGTKGSEVVVSA